MAIWEQIRLKTKIKRAVVPCLGSNNEMRFHQFGTRQQKSWHDLLSRQLKTSSKTITSIEQPSHHH